MNNSFDRHNGRVNISQPNISTLFKMQERIPAKQCSSFVNPLEGIIDNSLLSKAFFSSQNMTIIQNAIRHKVYQMSNKQYVVAPFDCDTLKIIMRGIFLQHSNNLNDNITEQIVNLNKMVVDYSAPKVYGAAQGQLKFLYDLDNLVEPIALPILSNQSDKFDLKLPNWF
jgi:hypothetical protein